MNPPPLNTAQLDDRVRAVARMYQTSEARVRRMLAAMIISQMLPSGVAVKG